MESFCFHFCMGLRDLSQLSDLHSQSLDSLGKCFYPLSHLSKCWLFLIWLRLLTKLNFAIGRCVLEKTVFIVFTSRAVRHPGVGSRNALASLLDWSSLWLLTVNTKPASGGCCVSENGSFQPLEPVSGSVHRNVMSYFLCVVLRTQYCTAVGGLSWDCMF